MRNKMLTASLLMNVLYILTVFFGPWHHLNPQEANVVKYIRQMNGKVNVEVWCDQPLNNPGKVAFMWNKQ